MDKGLRIQIAEMIHRAGEGHIPSAYSIVDIINVLYSDVLSFDVNDPESEERDYFILSKGHGSAALYAVLAKHGFIQENDLWNKSKEYGILGGHPDATKVPGVEASTGSLGHGVVTALGVALGLRIQEKPNKVFALIGDGESNEGTVWEMALVAANLELGNLCVIVDMNKSTDQILGMPHMDKKWDSFGWEVHNMNGHDEDDIRAILQQIPFAAIGKPNVVLADTVKGRGVSFMEVHGPWHHKIPTAEELVVIKKELS